MRVKAIRMLVSLSIFCSLLSVPVYSENLSNSIYLKNQVHEKNSFLSNWVTEIVDNTGDVGHDTDIAIAGNNMFISYYDFGNKDLKFARLIDNVWSITVVDSEGNVGRDASLALDSLGNPHISYYDEAHQSLKHAYFDGILWNLEVVDSNGDVGLYSSIIVDSTNHIHISYHDQSNGYLKYAKSVENGWNIDVVDSSSNAGEITSITLDKNDAPHISYTRDNYDLYHAYYSDNKWVSEKVDDRGILYGSTSIAVDPDGFIHILYYVVEPDFFSLNHAFNSNDGWYIELIDPYLWGTFGTGGANIVFDNSGRIHIGYFNWAWQTLNYAWKINNIWNLEIADSPELGVYVGSHAALAIDSQGIPHMSYMDNNNLAVKYAYKTEYRPGVPTPPSGIIKGKTGKTYSFTTTSQDLDNDKIQYGWDWNEDFKVDQWSSFINSGETCEMSHIWNEPGFYKIRVVAIDEEGFFNGYHLDENGDFNDWSNSLTVKISKNKISCSIVLPRMFIKFIEQIQLNSNNLYNN